MNPRSILNPRVWLPDALVGLSALVRLFPSIKPPNIAPMGGLSLVAGARMPLWRALLVPLGMMFLTDSLLKVMFAWPAYDPWVYGSFALIVLLGRLTLRASNSPLRIGSMSLVSSLLFFAVTNFGVWFQAVQGDPKAIYPPTMGGLATCYVQGLPYLGLTALGDLGFALVLFGAHGWLASPAGATERTPVEEAVK